MFPSLFTRALMTIVAAAFLGPVVAVSLVPLAAAAQTRTADAGGDVTECHDAALARQRTEVSADMTVPGFDASLGTLLEVQVPSQSVHLDTDAQFENTAATDVTFAEHMDYVVTFTSPGGLASPGPLTGTIQRVPTQTLAAFDGTLDYLGASAVTQPSTARDASTAPVASTEPGVLAAFTGGTHAFHVATTIGETFMGGGGNVEAQIHTFASAAVQVCYRYAPPVVVPPTTPPTVPVAVEAASVSRPVATPAATLPRTGRSTLPLIAAGIGAVGLGAVLALRNRRPRPTLQ